MCRINPPRVLGNHLSSSELKLVNRARDFAIAAHAGQRRVSGEPFIEHPLAVALFLSDLHLAGPTLAAALLHDVVEDTPITLHEICANFGPEIAFLVDGMTKITPDGLIHANHPTQVEVLRKANLARFTRAMIADPRIALIRLADRLHNMRTLGALPLAKRRRIAWETLTIYVPFARCLDLMFLHHELRWLALTHLDLAQKSSPILCDLERARVYHPQVLYHLVTSNAKFGQLRVCSGPRCLGMKHESY